MRVRSAIGAMLWENWRLTRVEAIWRLTLGVLFAAFLLETSARVEPLRGARFPPPQWILGFFSPQLALLSLMGACMSYWISIAKLNGGRRTDGFGHGYPFHFLYTQPAPTYVLVGAPMAYQALSIAAVYIVSALVLRATFGYPFPLLPPAAIIVAWQSLQWALQWGSTSRIADWAGTCVAFAGFGALLYRHSHQLPAQLELSGAEYALLAAITAASFGLSVAGVARQRRSQPRTAMLRTAGWEPSNWFASLLKIPCPTSSATWAQMWFELKSGGLRVLATGALLAVLIPLLFLASGFIGQPGIRAGALIAATCSPLAVLLLGGNAFGIRARQGRKYASAFEATQACATARMAGLKVLVRTLCVVAALAAVSASVWAISHLMPPGGSTDDAALTGKSTSPLIGWMGAIEGSVAAMTAYEQLALAFVVCVLVAVMVALRASFEALRARYPRRMSIAQALLAVCGYLLVTLAYAAHLESHKLGVQHGPASRLADAVFGPARWVAVAVLALGMLYFLWRGLVERLLTRISVGLAVLAAAAFAAAWVSVLGAAGVSLGGMPAAGAVWMLSPALLPLLASVLAPWALSRVRHA